MRVMGVVVVFLTVLFVPTFLLSNVNLRPVLSKPTSVPSIMPSSLALVLSTAASALPSYTLDCASKPFTETSFLFIISFAVVLPM